MKKIKEITFFGSNYKIAQAVTEIGDLKNIYCEKRSFNINIYNFAKLFDINFNLVTNKNEINRIKPTKNSVGISSGFGVIFKKNHINLFEYGIWNIHPGKLPEFRGRHPISWSFLTGEKQFVVTIHEINEEIDQGYLLAETFIYRDLNDTQKEIDEKVEHVVKNGLLKQAKANYFSNNKIKLTEGNYLERLDNKYKDINPEEFNSKFLFNLFKSQFTHGGIKVNNKVYKECVFYNENLPELYDKYELFKCKDNIIIGLKS